MCRGNCHVNDHMALCPVCFETEMNKPPQDYHENIFNRGGRRSNRFKEKIA